MKSKDYIGKIVEFDTVLPIQKIAVSDADTVAVLLKDGSVSRVNYYNKSGEVICNVEELDTSVEAKGSTYSYTLL